MGKRIGEHSFSIEMKSKEHIKRISLTDKGQEHALLEGVLGELNNVSLIEDVMLEIKGVNGILRVDITKKELEKLLSQGQNENQDNQGGE